MSFITDNLGTIITALILLAVIGGAVWSIVKKKKAGQSSCGCGCSNCAMGGSCGKKGT